MKKRKERAINMSNECQVHENLFTENRMVCRRENRDDHKNTNKRTRHTEVFEEEKREIPLVLLLIPSHDGTLLHYITFSFLPPTLYSLPFPSNSIWCFSQTLIIKCERKESRALKG